MKRERRDSRGDDREGQGRRIGMKVKKQKNNYIPPLPIPATRMAGLAQL